MVAPSFAFQLISPGDYLVFFTRKHMSRSRFSEHSPAVSRFEATLSESVAFATVATVIRSRLCSVWPSHFPRGLHRWIREGEMFSRLLGLTCFFAFAGFYTEIRFFTVMELFKLITGTTSSNSFRSTLRAAFLYAGLRSARHYLLCRY